MDQINKPQESESQKLLIYEDSQAIGVVRSILAQCCAQLDNVLQAYNRLKIPSPLTVSDIENIAARHDKIDDWLREVLGKNVDKPIVNGVEIEKGAFLKMIALPDYSHLAHVAANANAELKIVYDHNRFNHKFIWVAQNPTRYLKISVGRVCIDKAKLDNAFDNYFRQHISGEQLLVYSSLKTFIDFINEKIVAVDADVRKWQNPQKILDVFSFDNNLGRFIINPNYFKK